MRLLLKTVALAAALCAVALPATAQVNANAPGRYGNVALRVGFLPDPHDVTVTAGGSVDAHTVDDSCAGHIDGRADVTVRYTAGQATLYLSATSDSDTTLVVRAPDGSWHCDDDSLGNLDPLVSIESPRSGRYQIWVGSFAENAAPEAVVHVSEIAPANDTAANPAEAPDASLQPGTGTVALTSGFTPDPHTVPITAGGGYNATGIQGAQCVGMIARAPDYRVNWTAGSTGLPLIFSVHSTADTTLVINDAQGHWLCNDDRADGTDKGLDPSIRVDTPATGQYDVWVGTYGTETAPSTLSVSELHD